MIVENRVATDQAREQLLTFSQPLLCQELTTCAKARGGSDKRAAWVPSDRLSSMETESRLTCSSMEVPGKDGKLRSFF